MAGTLRNFTGIDAPYEVPDAPEVHLVTHEKGPEPLADEVIAALRRRGIGA
jgi:bifunctional enzyme CysN/CysC